VRLALYQPDNPHNTGAAIRVSACFAVPLVIIEPVGFPLTAKAVRTAALDYGATAEIIREPSWEVYDAVRRAAGRPLVLLTVHGQVPLWDADIPADADILFGQERAGAPENVHAAADLRVRIPVAARSLNLGMAVAITAAELRRREGWRQGWPGG